jgi:hypothetical protein
MPLILHTAAYWLMWTPAPRCRKPLPLRIAEFATIRLRLIAVAARITETGAAGSARRAGESACPDAAPLSPDHTGLARRKP